MAKRSFAGVLFGLSFALVLVISTALAGPQEAVDGAAVFKKRCAMCHGAEGKGFEGKTPDFTSEEWQNSMTDEQITDTVTNGKKGKPMPAFGNKLSADEIKAVVAHIRSLGKK